MRISTREHVVGVGVVARREGDRGLQVGLGGFGSGRSERSDDLIPRTETV